MNLTAHHITSFQQTVLDFYRAHGRSFPWRNHADPYAVLVSEIMLQQTQVSRVINKFPEFLNAFPTWSALAHAPLADVLRLWHGMGYNRRAKALRDIACIIEKTYSGTLPADPAILETFPWIGPHTAGSMCAFAFNMPTVVIETNIRTVFIHHFFRDQTHVHDNDIKPLVAQTIYASCPRDWYNALMDYGTHIKSLHPNPSRNSAHYAKQSAFKGSNREMRGNILKTLTVEPLTKSKLGARLNMSPEQLDSILTRLIAEGLITQHKRTLHIAQ